MVATQQFKMRQKDAGEALTMRRAGRSTVRSRVESESEVALICRKQQQLSHRRVQERTGSGRGWAKLHAVCKRPGRTQCTRGLETCRARLAVLVDDG